MLEKVRALKGATKEKISATKYSLLKKQVFNLESRLLSDLDFYKKNGKYLNSSEYARRDAIEETLKEVKKLTSFIKNMEFELRQLKRIEGESENGK